MSVDTFVEQGMFFRIPSEKYQSFLKISKYFTFPEFQEEFNFDLVIHLLSKLSGYLYG